MHYPKADRLYVKRKEGERGLVEVEAGNETQTTLVNKLKKNCI
jgi:hypothetical protein